MKQLSLRPYTGKLYLAESKKEYAKLHKRLFKSEEVLSVAQAGRFAGGCGKDDMWTYLVWASSSATLAHELSHVIFHVLERHGIDPRHDTGEVFCYMLSMLLLDAGPSRKK
jgi:succinate dehydrogenase/fumarate reductase flavoprotein subunit